MRGAAGTRWYETLQRYVCIEFVCVLVCTLLTAGLSCTDGIFPDFPSYPDLDTHDSLIVFSDASSPHKLFVNINSHLHLQVLPEQNPPHQPPRKGRPCPLHQFMLSFQKTERTQVS